MEYSVPLSEELREKLRLSHALSADSTHALSADSTPLMNRRSKDETVAIFDELLSQMEGITQTFYPTHQHQEPECDSGGTEPRHWNQNGPDTESRSNSGVEPDFEERRGAVAKRRVQSSDTPKGLIRPSSSASVKKGAGPEDHLPRAASVETEMVFATLPKKKKKSRWSGFRKIGSPLFRPQRKSFTGAATPLSSSSNHAHVSVTHPSPSVPLAATATPPSQLAHDSRSQESSSASMTGLVDQFLGERGVAGGAGRKRRGSSPRDDCLNALKVMTTLSSNQESLSSLISYICLPKCVTK